VLAAQVLNDPGTVGQLIEGVDYRNQEVAGVARAIPGTDWFLMTKLDRQEMMAEARRDATGIVLSGLLLLFAGGAGLMTLRQRQQLAFAQDLQQAQSERLRALHLLATISDSSSDAIFAKDLNNRFILFNRAAEKLVGKPQAEVLGKDETTLYPPEVARQQLADNRKVMDANLTLNIQEDVPTHEGVRSFITTKGPLHDDEGHVIGLYGIVHDITESKQVETRLRQQAVEMKNRNDELERINRAMVGRELAMIDLKRHINTLAQELGREPPFDLSFAEPERP
jgi:PAS domain S-box-containing protein